MSENSNDMTTPQEPIPAQAAEPIPPAVPLPAAPAPVAKSSSVRTVVLAGASAVVGAALVLGAGAIGYSIGHHDSENYREARMTVSADREGQQGSGPMMGHDDEYGMSDESGGMHGPEGMNERGMDPDGDNWSGENRDGGMMGGNRDGQGDGPMMQGPGGMMDGFGSGPSMGGNGIQDFLDQLQSGQGLTPDQQQFLDQLKGFVGGMRNQMG